MLNCGAFYIGDFRTGENIRFPSLPNAPIYFSIRRLKSFPQVLARLADLIEQTLEQDMWEKINLVADEPGSATPLVTVISQKRNIPMISPNTAKKPYGPQEDIEGSYAPDDRVILIDDFIRSGIKKIARVGTFRRAGLQCNDVLTVVSAMGATEYLSVSGDIALHKLYELEELIGFYEFNDLIPMSFAQRAREYLKEISL